MLANRLLEGNKDVYYIYQISTDSFPFNSFDKLSESEQKPQLGLLFLDKLKKTNGYLCIRIPFSHDRIIFFGGGGGTLR